MSRFYDRLKAAGKVHGSREASALFIADNIFAETDTDIFNCRLPYERTYIETRREGCSFGCFCYLQPVQLEDLENGFTYEPSHILWISGYLEEQKGKGDLFVGIRIEFEPSSYRPTEVTLTACGMAFEKYPEIANGYEVCPAHIETRFRELLAPIFATINLLNCNNVQIIDQAPPKLSKKHEKKHGQPLVTFKTLHITPMAKPHYKQELLQVMPQLLDNTKPLPLHEIRGHLKDYRDGKGLFGKHKGVYWWTPHLKGDPLNGVVVKDYQIDAPE